MAGRLSSLFRVFRGKKSKGSADASAQQPEESEQLQLLQDDAGTDGTQEQDPTSRRFHRAEQALQKFLHVRCRNTSTTTTEGMAEPSSRQSEMQEKPDISTASTEYTENSARAKADHRAMADTALTEDMANTNNDAGMAQGISKTDTIPTSALILAPTLDFYKQTGVSSRQQVPAMVRDVHQILMSHVTLDTRLRINILSLAEEHSADMVLTLLHCAPTCDRAAAIIWRTIGTWGPVVEKILPTLVCVMQDWPLNMSSSDGDNKAIFALAATVVLWVIVQVPECHNAIIHHSACLIVALLFQVFITTEQTPEEVENFWRACQEEHSLPNKPNRFAAQTMKALLCQLWCNDKVVALEHKRVWDTLLCADTHHYAVGLLARELRRDSTLLCTPITICLLKLLIREQPRWDLPALALLVELLECLDLNVCARRMLTIMSKHLQSECRERCRLALRGLVVLSKEPLMAESICNLSPMLLELLRDADGEMVRMTLSVFMNVLQDKDILVSAQCSTTAPKLAEALVPLFENDNRHVQLLSIHLFRKVMELVVEKGKKLLKTIVSQSLFSLLICLRDENQRVAEAAFETLLCAAQYLKRRDLEQLLKKEQALKFNDYLVVEDERSAPEHLHRALPFLRNTQKLLRQAAVRFIVIFGGT